MKARLLSTAAILFFGIQGAALGQWSTGSGGAIYYNGGNVGIGTANPSAPLHLYSNSTGDDPMMNVINNGAQYSQLQLESFSGSLANYGGVITGVSGRGTPSAPTATQSNDSLLVLQADGYTPAGTLAIAGYMAVSAENNWTNGSTPTYIEFRTNPSGTSNNAVTAMHITGSGNVGIGTTSPQHLLHVAGTIGAEQIIVSSTGADYVFDPKYKLAPLSEVASYVEENHHLPGIPSAEEMKKQGVSLGDMQTKLLAKIEELTLHMIETDERNSQLAKENREIINQNRELRTRMDALEHRADGAFWVGNEQPK